MPRLTIETHGGGDQSWLGSTHGIANARPEILDVSAFVKATHYPNGYIPSGTPVAKADGKLIPYGAGKTLAGFVLTDQKVVGDADFAVPVLDHGRVRVAKLPVAFTAPEAAFNATTIVFV